MGGIYGGKSKKFTAVSYCRKLLFINREENREKRGVSKSLAVTAQTPDQLSQKLGGKDEERKIQREKKLVGTQRNGAKHASAQIDEKDLQKADGSHDQKEGAVFGDPRKKAKAVASRMEAIEYRGEDEQNEEGGQKIDVVGGRI